MEKKQNSPLAVLIYILAALFLFYEMALQVSPSVMTHELMRDLDLGAKGLGIMAAFYFYSYTLMQIPAGLLFDRFGPRKLISVATIVIAMGGFFFALTTTPALASLGRFLMGIGSAFAFIGVLTVAARWFKPGLFAFLVGIAQFLAAMGAMGGELPLAFSVNSLGWRETINILAISGLFLAFINYLVIRDYPDDLAYHPHKHGLSVKDSLKMIFSKSQTYFIAIYAFCGWAPVSVFASLWGVPYLMGRYDIANTHAALIVAMVWIGLSVGSPLLGYFSDLLKRRCLLLRATSLLGLVTSLVMLYLPGVPLYMQYVLLFLFGIAASGQILSFALVKDNNRPSVTSTAIGFNNMANVAGGAIFQPLVGAILSAGWDGKMLGHAPIYATGDYNMALCVVPLCFLIGLLVSSFGIKETYCRSQFS
jgi:MFS family permease